MKTLRKTKIPKWYEFYRTPCPICGRVGGCMVHEKGDRVACIRIESNTFFSKNSALPSYLHWLTPKTKQKVEVEDVEEYQSAQKKDNETLSFVYRALLEYLELTDEHYEHLTSPSRGLTDSQVMIREYKSFPNKPWEIVRMLENEYGISDFEGIPGFYLRNNQYWTLAGTNGILIPFRNQYNQLLGFQYRLDNPPNDIEIKINTHGLKARIIKQPDLVQITFNGEIILEENIPVSKNWKTIYKDDKLLGWIKVKKGNRYFWLSSANKPKGTSTGNPAPVHVAIPSSKLVDWKEGTLHKAKSIWLTEGPLKADISSDYIEKLYPSSQHEEIGTTLIALPGVGAWRLALPIIKEMGAERINLCFDADSVSNPHVKKHLFECAKELKQLGVSCYLVIWSASDGKGIDDCLINSKIPQMKRIF